MDKLEIESVRQELRREQDEIWDPYDSHRTPELFHFTSPQGFHGIIEKHQLWCTDIRYVNDPREGDHGLSVVKSVMSRKSVYKPFKESVLRSDTLFGMKAAWTDYIACFCSGGEQPYMWREYASGSTGCALVFDYDAMFAGPRKVSDTHFSVGGSPEVSSFKAFGKPRVSVEFETSALKRVIRGRCAGDDLSVDKIKDRLRQHDFGTVPVVESAP